MFRLKIKQNKAFSLVELAVTVSVLGIISSMAIAQVQEYRERANDLTALTQLVQARTSFEALMADDVNNRNFNYIFSYGSGVAQLDELASGKQSLIDGTMAWSDQPLPGLNHDPKVNLRACGNSSVFMVLTSHSEGSSKDVNIRRGGVDRNDPRFLQHIFYSATLGSSPSAGTGTPYSYYDETPGRPAIIPTCPLATPPVPVP